MVIQPQESHVSVSVDRRIAHPFLQVQRRELFQFSIEIFSRLQSQGIQAAKMDDEDVTHNMAGRPQVVPSQ